MTGQEIMSRMLIFFDKGLPIKFGDDILIKTRWGVASQYTEKFSVIMTDRPIGFSDHHLEVWL